MCTTLCTIFHRTTWLVGWSASAANKDSRHGVLALAACIISPCTDKLRTLDAGRHIGC